MNVPSQSDEASTGSGEAVSQGQVGSNSESSDPSGDDQGPGWMPAIVAAMALMGIVGFFVCAISTWILYQKRTEFAIRTLQGDYLSQVEQSLLDPGTKLAVANEIEVLVADMQRGKYENWQSAAIMQRIQRLPVVQWGDLQAIDAFLSNPSSENLSEDDRIQGARELDRLRRAVELDKATSFDFQEVLQPVRMQSNASRSGYVLISPLEAKPVRESIRRAKQLADRSGVPDKDFPDIRIEEILHREIDLGASEGGY